MIGALLSPKLWIALAISALFALTYHFGSKSGQAKVQVKWDKERAEITAAALEASNAARAKEQALNTANAKITNDYNTQKTQRAADSVLSAGKLRNLQATLDRARSQQAPTTAGAVADPRLDIIQECAFTARRLGEAVESLAGTLTGLQAYTREVCLSESTLK